MDIKRYQKLDLLRKDLLSDYYAIVHSYGLRELPPTISAKATELMNHAECIRELLDGKQEQRQNESNATILGLVKL